MRGALLETAVVSAWYKAFLHRGERPPLYYWRTWDGEEVDLIIDWDNSLHPVEIKASATVVPDHARNLARWAEREKSASGLVVADVPKAFSLRAGIRVVPWHWL